MKKQTIIGLTMTALLFGLLWFYMLRWEAWLLVVIVMLLWSAYIAIQKVVDYRLKKLAKEMEATQERFEHAQKDVAMDFQSVFPDPRRREYMLQTQNDSNIALDKFRAACNRAQSFGFRVKSEKEYLK